MIEVSGLQFQYNKQEQLDFPDLRLPPKEHAIILGQSGSGKTTYLHMLAGLKKPQAGQIVYGDTALTELSGKRLDKFRGQKIGMVFQVPHLIAALTVSENIMLASKLSGISVPREELDGLLEELGLSKKKNAKIQALSEGQKQRVSIARALIKKPQVLLADEPTSALDDRNAENVIGLFLEMANQHGTSLLVTTHDKRIKSDFKNFVTIGA